MSHFEGLGFAGPVRAGVVRVRDWDIELVRPAEPDRLLDDPDVQARNRRDDYMPYWAYLWPGAFLLADAVADREGPIETECLELGCGLGLAGLVALRRGARVTFTDYDDVPLRFVAASAERNGFGPARFTCGLLDWRDTPNIAYPLVLGADLLYEARLVPLVVGVLTRVLADEGLALLADPYRVAAQGFVPALGRVGLRHETRPWSCRDETGAEVRGTIHGVWKPR